jgi:hypothetical protein
MASHLELIHGFNGEEDERRNYWGSFLGDLETPEGKISPD